MAETIKEPAHDIPVNHKCDICVIGGSCTGVFAAVHAARLGHSVIIIEKTNAFGGVAVNGMVNVWHTLMNTDFTKQIIGGLTEEVIDRLRLINAVDIIPDSLDIAYRFNSSELAIELDKLVLESSITPLLHTVFCEAIVEGGDIKAVVIENKDGRSAIQADVYIDASGDGDLFARAGVPFTVSDSLQPPSACAQIRNFRAPDFDFRSLYKEHHAEFGLEPDAGWDTSIPGMPGIQMFAQTHVFGADCSDASQLTLAEIEGRRQVRAVMDMIRKYGPQKCDIGLGALASYIGIRETRKFDAAYCLTEDDVLSGRSFEDSIAQGSYRVDVHYPDGGGFLFKYLDGTTKDFRSGECIEGRWRDPGDDDPTYYQIPYRCMINPKLNNAVMAGRMICTDEGAFGAIRVMVNLNQVGEAAGTAAHLAIEKGCSVCDVEGSKLRSVLNAGGSCLI